MSEQQETAPKTFNAALVAAQAEVGNIKRDATNPRFSKKYVSLAAIIEVVKPAFAKHGFAITQEFFSTESGTGIYGETMLSHEGGETRKYHLPSILMERKDAQSVGAAITYLRRYGLQIVSGTAGEEDDDGNGISGKSSADVIPLPVAGKTVPNQGIPPEVARAAAALGATVESVGPDGSTKRASGEVTAAKKITLKGGMEKYEVTVDGITASIFTDRENAAEWFAGAQAAQSAGGPVYMLYTVSTHNGRTYNNLAGFGDAF